MGTYLAIIAIIAGFAILIWAADRFVVGASATARNLGVSPLIIGLTIVAFATSTPEMFIAAIASWQGNPGLGIGNAIGSNIANIGLIIGVTALIIPLSIHSKLLKREYPVLIAIMILAAVLIIDGELSIIDGVILLIAFAVMVYWMVIISLNDRNKDAMAKEFSAEIPKQMPMRRGILLLVLGLAGLIIGSKILVVGSVDIAQKLGMSDLVVGLTIVAVGTSLPELAAAIASVIKKEPDLALGNVVGSNMFNTLAVLPLPGIIAPGNVADSLLIRDFPVMIGITIVLYIMSLKISGPSRIGRVKGLILLLGFSGYLYWVFLEATPS